MGMLSNSNISWTEKSWNPASGCQEISPGCKNCYAKVMAERLMAAGSKKYENGFDYVEHYDLLDAPIRTKKPFKIFVNSMSDVFIKDATEEFVAAMFETMMTANWHTYQILTKRPEAMSKFIEQWLEWKKLDAVPGHIWLGTSVENNDYLWRIDVLRSIPAKVKFVSCEPLLEEIKPDFTDIQWTIIGGESGHKARHFDPEWAATIIAQARKCGTACFFKQVGGRTPNAGGHELHGKTIMEYPVLKQI